MKTKLLGTALALGLASTAVTAGGVGGGNANSNWTIYGWQNWSWEHISVDTASVDLVANPDGQRDRDFSRINNNAANIGFAATLPTGMSMGGQDINVNFQCEQFTFHNRFTGTGFCNRNSKISLSGAFGEIMFGQWLLPYNEMVAQWVDPFYDAGADSHTSIMGSVGYGTLFYNGGFGFTGATAQGFNRRQEEVIQYWSPNMNGLSFRIATTNNNGNEETEVTTSLATVEEVDPRIWSTGVAYENTLANGGNVWLAATYQQHDEWAAASFACEDSDDKSYRLAGRYIHAWGGGQTTQLSVMWEDLEYDWENCAGGTLLSGNTDLTTDTANLDMDRTAWMISGKQTFGNGFDFRFSYMDADEFDCSSCDVTEDDTDATAFNLGIFYTMPAGTELRLTYSDVDNEDNANYDFGIGGAGTVVGGDADMFAFGIVQWF